MHFPEKVRLKKRKKQKHCMMECPRVIISVDGIVGAGKSTLISNLRGFFNKVPEPVGKYQTYVSQSGEVYNPLEIMYSSPRTDSVAAQEHIIKQSCLYYREQLSTSLLQMNITERSIGSPHIFIKAKAREEYLSPFSKDILLDMHNNVTKMLTKYLPNMTIYLRCQPEAAYERLKHRAKTLGQPEDLMIPLSYLQALHEEYEEYYMRNPKVENVVMIDVTDLDEKQVIPKIEPIFERFQKEFDQKQTEKIAELRRREFQTGNGGI